MLETKQKGKSQRDAEVVIIGGGPVGMGLAIELGQRGVRTIVLERYAEPQQIPKGQNLTQRTMEHFHFWGAEKELRAARTVPRQQGIGGLTTYGTLLGPYSYDWMQRDLVNQFYYTPNERLPQYLTQTVLRDRATALNSIIPMYGWSVERLDEDGEGVNVTIARRDGTGRRIVRAAYAVGCDGSRSNVREGAGITQTLSKNDSVMVLLLFRSRELHTLLERYPGKAFYNVLHPELKGYWKFFGRVDFGNTWFYHAPVPRGTTAENFDFQTLLHEAVGAKFEVEIEYTGFWDMRFAVADAYRKGRIFIAGDAAHSHPPYGGYGVNSGLEDARNLGWKLAATLQGWGSEKLLDSYDAERRPVFRSTIDDHIAKAIEIDREFLAGFDPARDKEAFEREWNARAQGADGEVDAFEPNYEGSPVVFGGGEDGRVSSAKGTHRFEARAGHHLAPAMLSSGKNVFEVLGQGYTLLAFGTSPQVVQAFSEAAALLSMPLTVVEDKAEGEPARYAAQLVLVRPDQFVTWVGHADAMTSQAVRNVLATAQGGTEVVMIEHAEFA